MLILNCADPLRGTQPDPDYAGEMAAVRGLGVAVGLVSYEALVNAGDAAAAVRRVDAGEPTLAIYRGWMLTPEQDGALYGALAARGVTLINSPAAYRHCHYLPESYAVLAGHTPETVWLPADGDLSLGRIMDALRPFGAGPVLVKDYVKSRKHEWAEACYIPSAADAAAVGRVVGRFRELQGDDLAGGLVFRAFVELEPLGPHPASGMPLTKEYRLFFRDGRLVYAVPYWDAAIYAGAGPPLDLFVGIAGRVQSRFFTMDVAQRQDGGWTVIELGDGQVAGLPRHADVPAFYRALLGAA
jgi:hypothetical protein